MFLKRLFSGIILIALSLLFIIPGGLILLFSTMALSVIGLFELYRAFSIQKSVPAVLGYLFTIVCYLNFIFPVFGPGTMMESFVFLFIAFLISLLIAYVFLYPKYGPKEVFTAFFGIFYVSVMLSFIYLTREMDKGYIIVWLIFLASWGTDTCAYCVGVLFGKHKMSPKLSPKKSVEGAIGGIAGAIILTFIYLYIFRNEANLAIPEIVFLSISAGAGGFISMIGDLAASAIKRHTGIKDYGKLIPGHGGILDRFDSVIITAPIIYYFAVFLSRSANL
ncbi:MAG: phosphatidate cytidylyltransferase [Lachnospiraceae bacterium]|nr:phosphatidate cytidylyltransferase [Lachnospiraceae bacterium]